LLLLSRGWLSDPGGDERQTKSKNKDPFSWTSHNTQIIYSRNSLGYSGEKERDGF
jgi:hypothetical protein